MSRSMIQAVIFDRDGVLTYFDTEAAGEFYHALLPISIFELAAEWQQWGSGVGFPASINEEEAFFFRFWQHIGRRYALSPATTEQLLTSRYTDYVQAFPDARPALTAAKERGMKTAVLSNFTLASLDESLAAAGLDDLIDVTCASTVIGAAKPSSSAYLAVTDALNLSPRRCLFFDDEMDYVVGGRNVGMQAYLVDRRGDALVTDDSKFVQDLWTVADVIDEYNVNCSGSDA